MGCLMICTAPGEALSHPEVGADLKGLIRRLDNAFARRLERAQRDGEAPREQAPEVRGRARSKPLDLGHGLLDRSRVPPVQGQDERVACQERGIEAKPAQARPLCG